MSSISNFFHELQRRDVFRAVVAYTVVAWLLVQVADLLLETFAAPQWIMQTLVILLAIGFPVTLVLAWVYEITTQGIKRTSDVPEDTPTHAHASRIVDFVVIGILIVALIASLYINTLREGLESMSPADNASIAVLPFTDMSPNNTEKYFAQGFHDDLLTMLTRVDGLRVIGRTTMERIDPTASVTEIGEILDVSSVMEGSVQRDGDKIRVNVQLLDATNEGHLWAATYDRFLTDVFRVQSEIGGAVVNELREVFSIDAINPAAANPVENTDAYLFELQGREFLRQSASPKSLTVATELFNRALEADPQYARAYAGLCEANLGWYYLYSKVEYFNQGEQACFRALTFNDQLPEVRIALGKLYLDSGQYQKAKIEFDKALKLHPGSADALIGLAHSFDRLRAPDRAETYMREAITRHPSDWSVLRAISDFLYTKERYDEAAGFATRLTTLSPENSQALVQLGAIEYMRNNYEGALAAWQSSLELAPSRSAYSNTGLMQYYLGNFEDSVTMQQKAIDLAPNDHRAWGRMADAYRFIPGKESAAESGYRKALERAKQSARINAKDWYLKAHIALYHANLDEGDDARKVIQTVIDQAPNEADVYYYAAIVERLLGDEEQIFTSLQKAIDLGFSKTMIANEPDFRNLRDSERFQALLQ